LIPPVSSLKGSALAFLEKASNFNLDPIHEDQAKYSLELNVYVSSLNSARQTKSYYTAKRVKAHIIKYFVSAGALILVILIVPETHGEEIPWDYNHGLGKLGIRSQSPAQSLRMTFPMLIPGNIKPGWGSHIHFSWVNIWAKEKEFQLDYEMLDSSLAVSYGFNKRFGLAMAFDNRNCFGGALDSFIQGFHDLFGIDQGGRDEVPQGSSVIEWFNPKTGKKVAEIPAGNLNNNGLWFLLNYNIMHGDKIRPSLNVYGVVRYALKSPDLFKTDFWPGSRVCSPRRKQQHWKDKRTFSSACPDFV